MHRRRRAAFTSGGPRRRHRPAILAAERLEPRTLLAFAPAGAEFRANTFPENDQSFPALASDADGDFVVAWDSVGEDGSGSGIYAQRYAASGQALGAEFQVNTTSAGQQRFPAVATDADGDFVVAWQGQSADGSDYDVYARRYTAAGEPLGEEFRVKTTVTGTQGHPTVAAGGLGAFVIAWESNSQDGSGSGVYARRYSASGAPTGVEFRDTR